MRYVCMHKAPKDDGEQKPSPQLITDMGRLVGEAAKSGILLGGGGLRPSRERLRLTFQGGRCTITEGPLVGGNELPAGICTIKVRTLDQAIEWAKRFAAAAAVDEVDLGPLTEPWDLGICEKPEDPPLQFMILPKATKAFEAGQHPSGKQAAELSKLTAEMVREGVLTFFAPLQPSRQGKRLLYRGGVRTIVDGPFTESKELIGGFCMLQMRSIEEMLAWADRYAKILGGTLEIDIRTAAEPSV
jgi:hypothetical protein